MHQIDVNHENQCTAAHVYETNRSDVKAEQTNTKGI